MATLHGDSGVRGAVRHVESTLSQGAHGELRRSMPYQDLVWHHAHPEAEFNLVIRGTGSYVIEDERVHELRPRTLIWLMPGKMHKLIRGPDLEIWSLVFRTELLKPEALADLEPRPSRLISTQEFLGLDRLLADIAQDSDNLDTFNTGVNYAVTRALRAGRDQPSSALKPVHPAVVRALEIMRNDEVDTSLSSLAVSAGIAPHYLSRLLMEHTGRNFLDWRNRMRLDRFMKVYRPGDNLMAVALDAGFGSYARFHAIFRELVGSSPKEWAAKIGSGEADLDDTAASAESFGDNASLVRGTRQRWAQLLPMASPALQAVLGENFLQKTAAASCVDITEPDWLAPEGVQAPPTQQEIRNLVLSFATQNPEIAAEYGRILESWDVGSYMDAAATVIADPDVPPPDRSFTSLLAALMLLASVPKHRSPVTPAAIILLQNQMRRVLRTRNADQKRVREAMVAMECHFVVIRQSALSVLASNDAKSVGDVLNLMSQWSIRTFGNNLYDYVVQAEGLAIVEHPAPTALPFPNKSQLGQ